MRQREREIAQVRGGKGERAPTHESESERQGGREGGRAGQRERAREREEGGEMRERRDLQTLFPVDNAHFLDRHLRAAGKKKRKEKKCRVLRQPD